MATKQEAIAELARRELKRRGSLKESSTKVNSINGSALDTLLAGPFMTNKMGDVPSLLTSAVDGLSGGAIGNVVEQPKEFGVSGMTGAGVARGANMLAGFMGKEEPLPSTKLMPEPETVSGAISGTALSTLTPVAGEAALARFLKRPKPPTIGRLEELLQKTEADTKFRLALINKSQAIETRRIKSQTMKDLSDVELNKSLIENNDLKQKAYETVLKTRDKFSPYANKLSGEFGEAYQQAAKGVKVPLDKQINVFDGIAEKLDLRNPLRKIAPEEASFLKYIDELKSAQEQTVSSVSKSSILDPKGNPVEKIIPPKMSNARDLLDVDKEIKSLLGSSYGKQWGSAQRIHTETRRAFTDLFGDSGNPLNTVRARFKHRLAFKDRLFDVTRPFDLSGENKVSDEAVNFFANAGKKNLVGDDLAFYKNMQREIGDDVFSDVYSVGNKLKSLDSKATDISKSAESTLDKLTREMNTAKGRATVESFNKKAKYEGLINEAEKKDIPRKLIKMVAKEAAYALKRKVNPF